MMQGNKVQQNPYLTQKIMSASPEQLISYLYDAAIAACGRDDLQKSSRAVRELISALNFEYKDIAVTFFQVYRYINNLISQRRFEEARQMLTDLKSSWATAMKVA